MNLMCLYNDVVDGLDNFCYFYIIYDRYRENGLRGDIIMNCKLVFFVRYIGVVVNVVLIILEQLLIIVIVFIGLYIIFF